MAHTACGILYLWETDQGSGLSRPYQIQEADFGHLGKDYLSPKYLEHDLELGGRGGERGSERASPLNPQIALWEKGQLQNGQRGTL